METKKRQKKKLPELDPAAIPVVIADPQTGLTPAQALERMQGGCLNTAVEPPSKSVRQIVLSNIFTYFNLVFFILAGAVIFVGSWRNLTFMGVVLVNIAIGIVQELKAKKTLDKLTILNSPRATVIRDGEQLQIDVGYVVRDDIVIFPSGSQIYADAVVAEGTCQVNESLITGESDEITKNVGDTLLSGSFIVSGSCRARITAVSRDAYISKLTAEAKSIKKPQQSEMMKSLTRLVKWIGIIVIPFGVILTVKEYLWLGRDLTTSVTSTVAALIGMIPEGLYLLTSLALVTGVMRLAKKQTLVHDLACIETLARVDTLCVDKTGTITESKMVVEDIVLLCEDRFVESDIRMIMADYVYAMRDDNDTMAALRRYFTDEAHQQAIGTLPFTSAKKYGGVSFDPEETYLLGAPEVLLGERIAPYREKIDEYARQGCRVLLLALYDGTLEDETPSAEMLPLSLILLNNKIRETAPDTFSYFAEQGVCVKVISGDNPMTVGEVARRAGIPDAEKTVDARTLKTPEEIRAAANVFTVFGRVTPEQKRLLIMSMREAGHTVAMTGDGVNDVLALKAADCSIAMASGSEAASQVSHIVLLDSDFSAMPSVVEEGRRVINNIERSAALYLVKNIFSFVLAFITLFAALPYPFTPAQLSLISGLTIGVPSFVLAMEPNKNRVQGHFLPNVLFRALPAAITDILLVVGTLLFYIAFQLNEGALSTICTAVIGVVGLSMVHYTCRPYNKLRTWMMIAVSAAFAVCFLFLKSLFTLSVLQWSDVLIMVVLALLAFPMTDRFTKWLDLLKDFLSSKKQAKEAQEMQIL